MINSEDSSRICLGGSNFKGKILDFKVYEVAMTKGEINSMYSTKGCSGGSCQMCDSDTLECYSECKDDEYLSKEKKCLKCDSACASCFGPYSS